MKQRLKQHEVNNSKNKRVVTLRLFFLRYTTKRVTATKTHLLPHETTSETTQSQQQ